MTEFYNVEWMKDFRRKLRRRETPAEKRLWDLVRNRQVNGLKFRRQFSVDRYVLDFYCPQCKLAVEADGSYHYAPEQVVKDSNREKYLAQFGIKVLRFDNEVILKQPELVVSRILEEVEDCRL